jgi:N-acetylmuramoyl-L-alanine amidase
MSKICLDAGHGGIKPGAEFRGLLEKNVTLDIVLQTGGLLEVLGYEVIYTRKDDSHVELMERCNIANNANCDIFVSVHCNADDDDSDTPTNAKGEEIWIYNESKQSMKLAKTIADEVDAFFPDEPFRGIKSSTGLIVLKYTNMPAVLIECGFIDRSDTNEAFRNPTTIERIGQLLAKGVDEYFKS